MLKSNSKKFHFIPVLGMILMMGYSLLPLKHMAQVAESPDKGNKWEQRYLHFHQSRTRASGKPVTASDLTDLATPINRFSDASRAADSAWMPEGPNYITPSKDPASSHGVCRINCIAFHPTDTHIFWVGIAQGGVWKTTNGGQSWISLTDELPLLRISDIAIDPRHPDTMYISVCDYAYIGIALQTDGRKRHSHYGLGVYKSTDGGQTWIPTGLTFEQHTLDETLIRRLFVHPDSSEVLCAAGFTGIWKSRDGGANWTHIKNDLIWDIESNPVKKTTLFATGGFVDALQQGKAYIARSYDFGETWQTLTTGIPQTGVVQRVEIHVAAADTHLVYAVSCGINRGLYAIHRSKDGGNNWTTRTRTAIGKDILEWGSGSNTGGQGTYDLCILADPVNPARLYVGGINLWGSADSGQTWDGISYWLRNYGYTPHADQHYFAANPLDNKIYVCNDGGLFRTKEVIIGSWQQAKTISGYQWPTQWEDLSGGMQTTSFYRLGLSRQFPGYIVAGAQDNSTFYRLPDGRWFNLFGGDGMEGVLHPQNPERVIGSSQFGNFYITSDTGMNYYSISFDINEQGEWTTPFIIDPQDENHYLAAYANVWETRSVSSWIPVSSFSSTDLPASALAVCTKYPKYMVMARRPDFPNNTLSQLWVRNKAGVWFNRTNGLPDSLYFTYVITDDSLPGRIWVTCGGFDSGIKVYHTRDAGLTWENISRNLPNLPVNCIVQDECSPLNTVYVGTDHGVYYTNDSLDVWKPWHYTLPAVIVSELEIHYSERRMYAATFGRGIWSVNLVDTVLCNPYLSVPLPEDTLDIPSTEAKSLFDVRVAPNPVQDKLQLYWQSGTSGQVHWGVVDVMGRRVSAGILQNPASGSSTVLQTPLQSGVYYMELKQGGVRKVLRFTVL